MLVLTINFTTKKIQFFSIYYFYLAHRQASYRADHFQAVLMNRKNCYQCAINVQIIVRIYAAINVHHVNKIIFFPLYLLVKCLNQFYSFSNANQLTIFEIFYYRNFTVG